MLISSYTLQDRVLRSPMIGQMLQGLRPLGLAGIGVLPGPLRKPLGITRPLLKPGDYAGLRIGIPQSRVEDATMRALGVTPVGVQPGVAITGLDGLEQPVSLIAGTQDEAGKYLTANVSTTPSARLLSTRCPPPAGALPRSRAAV